MSHDGVNWIFRFRVGPCGGLWCKGGEFIDRLATTELCSLNLYRRDAVIPAPFCSRCFFKKHTFLLLTFR